MVDSDILVGALFNTLVLNIGKISRLECVDAAGEARFADLVVYRQKISELIF